MELAEAIERLTQVTAACTSPDTVSVDVRAALRAATEVQAFLAARRAELVTALNARPGSFAEAAIADTSGCSLGQASRETERAATLQHASAFAAALSNGAITADHVDALTRAGRGLDAPQREALFDQQNALAAAAASSTVRAFDELVKRRARQLRTESGEQRLDRQRRDSRLRTWVDGDDMFNVAGRFDPVTGVELARCIRHVADALSAAGTPDDAPADSLERHRYIQARAVAQLITSPGRTRASDDSASDDVRWPTSGRSRVDAVVVVDATQTDGRGGPVVDWGIPVELPHAVLADVLGASDPDVVVVANGLVLHAPGRLDLGRTTRLANRAQRRALRGLYVTCVVPGCSVHYDRCKLHHIVWWRHGGRTDLHNLLPVCQHHHTRIHDDGWQVELGRHRELTVQCGDGHVMTTGPPTRRAAA